MTIELEEPFTSHWRKGYIVTNKEPRRHVVLYNSDSDRTTISYARYLMSVKLGRYLTKDEIVDHINGDKMDDRIENYQIITTRENNIKAQQQNNTTRAMVRIECACGKIFDKVRNCTHLVIKTKPTDYCSRMCARKFSRKKLSIVILEYRK